MISWQKAKNYAGYAVLTVVAIPVMFFATYLIFLIIASWPDKLYTQHINGFEFCVIYHPGGGATGPVNELEVRVSGRGWDDKRLAIANAADSVAIGFLNDSTLQVVFLRPDYVDMSRYYWFGGDSIVFDLTREIRPVRYDGPYSRRDWTLRTGSASASAEQTEKPI